VIRPAHGKLNVRTEGEPGGKSGEHKASIDRKVEEMNTAMCYNESNPSWSGGDDQNDGWMRIFPGCPGLLTEQGCREEGRNNKKAGLSPAF